MKYAIAFLFATLTSTLCISQTFQKEILESEGLSIEEVQVADNEDITILSSSQEGVYLTYLDKEGNLIDHLMICDENPPSASVGNKLNLHKLKKFDNNELLIVLLTENGLVVMKIDSDREIVFSKRLPIAIEASALTFEDGTFAIVSSTIGNELIIRKFNTDGLVHDQKKIVEVNIQNIEHRLDIAGNNETIFISTYMKSLDNSDLQPHLIALDNSLTNTHTRELDPETIAQIEVDNDNNLIVRGITNLMKFDEELMPVWATVYVNYKDDNDYFFIDNENNIVGLGIFGVNELDLGLSTFKYSNNGFLIYAKRLLDGYPRVFGGIYKSGDNILVTSRSAEEQIIVRKLNALSEAADCGSIDMCFSFIPGQPISSERNFTTVEEISDIAEDYSCAPTFSSIELRHVCTPIEEPFATFELVDDTLCYDEILEIVDSTVYKYGQANWTLVDNNDIVVYSSTDRIPDNFNDLEKGSYKLVHSVKFANCEYLDSSSIYVNTIPFVELPNDTTVCDEVINLSFTGENYTSYEWNIESQDRSIAITESGLYEITVTNECGKDSDAIEIEFVDCEAGVFMPNIITSNSNSQYDFEIYHKGIVELKYIIYDRWGNPIHRAETPNLVWSINDISTYSKGVYVVYITYTTEKGEKKYLVKDLTII